MMQGFFDDNILKILLEDRLKGIIGYLKGILKPVVTREVKYSWWGAGGKRKTKIVIECSCNGEIIDNDVVNGLRVTVKGGEIVIRREDDTLCYRFPESFLLTFEQRFSRNMRKYKI